VDSPCYGISGLDAATPILFRLSLAHIDSPESKQILAKLAGKNQHLRKANISEVGSLCSVKFMGCNMYRKKTHRWTEWPRGQSEYKHNNIDSPSSSLDSHSFILLQSFHVVVLTDRSSWEIEKARIRR
jgi:hypothetical protein